MKAWELLMVLAVILVGCDSHKTKDGETLTESGEIYDVAFVPSGHGRDTAVGYNFGKGGGVTVTPVNIHIPARYAITFKCQHGKFVIEGDKAKAIYEKFDKGDLVTIFYCEVFEITKESTNMVDLRFLHAASRMTNEVGLEKTWEPARKP